MISTPYDLSADMDIMDLVCDLMYTKLVTVKNILLENICSYLIFIECISQQVELVGEVWKEEISINTVSMFHCINTVLL